MSSEHVPAKSQAPHPTQELLERLESRIAASYQSPLAWSYAKHGHTDNLESDHGQVASFEIDDDAMLAMDAVNSLPNLISTIRELQGEVERLRDRMSDMMPIAGGNPFKSHWPKEVTAGYLSDAVAIRGETGE